MLVKRKFKCDAKDDECRILLTTCHTHTLIKEIKINISKMIAAKSEIISRIQKCAVVPVAKLEHLGTLLCVAKWLPFLLLLSPPSTPLLFFCIVSRLIWFNQSGRVCVFNVHDSSRDKYNNRTNALNSEWRGELGFSHTSQPFPNLWRMLCTRYTFYIFFWSAFVCLYHRLCSLLLECMPCAHIQQNNIYSMCSRVFANALRLDVLIFVVVVLAISGVPLYMFISSLFCANLCCSSCRANRFLRTTQSLQRKKSSF